MDEQLRQACIAYNSVLLHQPEDCRDQTSAMHAAISPILFRLSVAEARVGVLEEALREARSSVEAWGAYAAPYFAEKHDLAGDLARIDAALTQEPSHEPE